MVFVFKDESGNFVCPCGFKRPVKFNVERHMLVCKTVKAATMQVDETEVAALKESLAAKELLLTAGLRTRGSTTISNVPEKSHSVRPIGAQPTPLDGLMGGSVGSPCDVFSWAVGHPMATPRHGGDSSRY